MPKVGDTIQVIISGGILSGPNNGASIQVGPGASMNVSGVIIQDLGTKWLVRLSISVGGANTIEVSKY